MQCKPCRWSENAGKRLRCPKCQTIVEVPDGIEDDVVPTNQKTILWKVVVGIKKGGPFSKAKTAMEDEDEDDDLDGADEALSNDVG